jgi:hypothetical protein
VEGLIWDATLPLVDLEKKVEVSSVNTTMSSQRHPPNNGSNPLLLDDRDEDGEKLLSRGIRLFRHLADNANNRAAVGVSYSQLVCFVHRVERFHQVVGRSYLPSDTGYIMQFANQITEAAGGPIVVTRDGVTIALEMDAFVWQKRPPHLRDDVAFVDLGYSRRDWLTVFPDTERRLLTTAECDRICVEEHH